MFNITITMRSGAQITLEGVAGSVADKLEDAISQDHAFKHNTGAGVKIINPRHIESVSVAPKPLQPY